MIREAGEGRQQQGDMKEEEKTQGRRREAVNHCAGRLMGPHVQFRAGT